jgi:uncharacterized protein YecT (DUF1311 family)
VKNTLCSILFLIAFILPLAQTHAQSQTEMNREAAANFEKADAQLNKVYAQVMAKLDEQGKAKLKAAQRAWIAFRDAQAELEADSMRDGTGATALRSESAAATTQQRTESLKEFLKELDAR